MKRNGTLICLVVLTAGLFLLSSAAVYAAPTLPSTGEHKNMKLVGYNDVQGRETLQVTAKGDFAFLGHHNRTQTPDLHFNPLTGEYEENGTTILDISDPKRPEVVVHIPNVANRNSRSAVVVYDFRGSGRDILVRNSEGQGTWYFQVIDITDITSNGGTNWFIIGKIESTGVGSCSGPAPCGGILTQAHKGYLSEAGWFYGSGAEPGFRSRHNHLLVWDLSDIAEVDPDPDQELGASRFVGRAWILGQKLTEDDPGERLNCHHPVVDEEFRQEMYCGFLSGGDVFAADISEAPTGPDLRFPNVWHLDLGPNQRAAGHTTAVIRYDEVPNIEPEGLPMYFALHSEEGTGQDVNPPGAAMRTKAYMIDVTDAFGSEVATVVETWQVPNEGYVYKGGRFGPHQFNETIDSKYNTFEDRIAYFAYFNAGVRAVDISDPYNLKEIGYYVPEKNENTLPVTGGQIPTMQINDVTVDYRGLILASDRVGTGFYILEYTGPKP